MGRRFVSRVALCFGIAAAMVLAADPALAAGTLVGGVSTLLGLLAGVWAVLAARGSALEANGAAVWLVGGAVVGGAGWAGRRLLLDRLVEWWRLGLVQWAGLLRWVDGRAVRIAGLRVGDIAPGERAPQAREASTTRSASSVSTRSPSSTPAPTATLIHRCADTTWPAALDRDQLIAEARRCFLALQAAWDINDTARLAALTTPDMLADVQSLLDARGHAPNHTDVLTLDAELLCIEAIGSSWCASLEFSGFIRESTDAAAVPFRELWMLASPIDGVRHWRLARQQALL